MTGGLVFSQVLTLAHQLDPNILRRGVSAALWDDLRYLLNMLPQAEGEGEGDPRLGMITTRRGPSILATDAAVTAVEVRPCCNCSHGGGGGKRSGIEGKG